MDTRPSVRPSVCSVTLHISRKKKPTKPKIAMKVAHVTFGERSTIKVTNSGTKWLVNQKQTSGQSILTTGGIVVAKHFYSVASRPGNGDLLITNLTLTALRHYDIAEVIALYVISISCRALQRRNRPSHKRVEDVIVAVLLQQQIKTA